MKEERKLVYVGKSVPMIDAAEKVKGQAKFATDMVWPGMLHAKVLRSPIPHGLISGIDTSLARKVPGVKAVLTGNDTPKVKFGRFKADEMLLALDKVRYIGDEVAAVVATDEDIAQEALDLIKVDYQELPAVFDPEEALRPDAPRLHEEPNNIAFHLHVERGEVEAAFEQADLVLADRFVTSQVHHACLEPMAAVAHWNGAVLAMWLPAQMPHVSRELYAQALNIAAGKIRIFQTYTGGGFGAKMEHKAHPLCGLFALATGKPVRLAYGRKEDFGATLARVPMRIDLKLGVKRDGAFTAKEVRIVADNGAYTNYCPLVVRQASIRPDSLYRFQNIRADADLVYTNKVPTGAFRGFGNPQITFALESLLDMAAEQLSIDPCELRLRNAVKPGDTSVHGWELKSCGLAECIKSAAQATGWGKKRATNRGLGIACCMHSSGSRPASPHFDGSSALVKIDEEGNVTLLTGEVDIGQGARTVMAQIVAEELGVEPGQVAVPLVDTALAPYNMGTFATRVTTLGGNAVRLAALDAREQLFQVAAEMLEAALKDLTVADGRIHVAGAPSKSVSVSEAARKAAMNNAGKPILGQGVFVAPGVVIPDRQTGYGNVAVAYPFAAHLAEVEVDKETGRVTVTRYVAAHDLGKTINPMAAQGQVEGGVCQGMGFAMYEDMKFDQGKLVSDGFASYCIPTATDPFPIESIFVESGDPIGPYGAKGLGEPVIVPVAAAIANAIYNAVGVRIKELPITQEKVLMALKKAQSGD